MIQQHHGTSLVAYFYKRAIQQQQDAREGGKIMNIREEDIPDVRERKFPVQRARSLNLRRAGSSVSRMRLRAPHVVSRNLRRKRSSNWSMISSISESQRGS